MNEQKRSILVVLTQSPYGAATAREALDAVLTAAAFEVPVSLLFTADAVYQLLPDQQTDGIAMKSMASTLPVLPIYDVENIYIDKHSMQSRGVDATSLLLPVVPLDTDAQRKLFQNHDRILSF